MSREEEFLAACARLPDSELCNGLSGAIEDKYGYPVTSGSPASIPERTLHLVWSLWGFGRAEGLETLLCNEPEHLDEFAEALEIIGMPELSRLVARLDRNPRPDEEIPALEKEFYRLGDETERKAATFVRKQLGAFSHLCLRRALADFDRESENIAYLGSLSLYSHNFSYENEGRIPSFEELKAVFGSDHEGLAGASPEDYTILISGRFEDHDESDLHATYNRPIGGKIYAVTVGGFVRPRDGG